MTLPERETYGGSPNNAMRIEVTGDLTLWMSYQRLIAFRIGGLFFICRGDWSKTTTRHVGCVLKLAPATANYVGEIEFTEAWEKHVARPLARVSGCAKQGPKPG